jgi:hypothetical protein
MSMDINWLIAPFYEVSFIKTNDFYDTIKVNEFIKNLETLNYNIKLIENNIDVKINNLLNKDAIDIELKIYINMCGKKTFNN